MEKIRIPKLIVVKISDDALIHIDDQIYGTVVMKLLKEDGSLDEGWEVRLEGYSGEHGGFMTVPKVWIGRRVLIKYEREVDAEVAQYLSPSKLFYIDDNGDIKKVKGFDCEDDLVIKVKNEI